MSITKNDLAIKISKDLGVTQQVVKKVIDSLLTEIISCMEQGKAVELRNFGVFKVKQRSSRVGRNPRTGIEVAIPEKKVATFKVGKIMKKKVTKLEEVGVA